MYDTILVYAFKTFVPNISCSIHLFGNLLFPSLFSKWLLDFSYSEEVTKEDNFIKKEIYLDSVMAIQGPTATA